MNNCNLKLKIQHHLYQQQNVKKKYLGINIIKYVQDLYEENDETLMKEIKESLNKWRYILCMHTDTQE